VSGLSSNNFIFLNKKIDLDLVSINCSINMTTYYEQNKLRILEKYDANFVTLIENQLAYYYLNRTSRIQYQLAYHFENHEQYLDYQREYYQKNKVKLLASRAEVVFCSCNKKIKKGNMSEHLKTNLHKKLLQIFNSSIPSDTSKKINNNIEFIIINEDGTEEPRLTYYQRNKDRIAIQNATNKFKCVCGSEINTSTQSRHKQSKKHQEFIDGLNNDTF
jgi:hypothetical protein